MTTKVALGVALAFVAWGAMFGVDRRGFWTRAAVAAASIAAYAVGVDTGAIGHLLARRHWAADLGVGLASGLVFYAVFWVGEQLLVIVLPALAAEVGDLYSVKGRGSTAQLLVVLAVAAPGEELFFRGLLWHRAGVVAALVIYAAVHLPERKVILPVAALVGGAWWGALFVWTGGLVAPIASHLLWIVLIVAVQPATPTGWALRLSARLHPDVPVAP
ncbi:MAG TPA: CPBP family intramembrane glutamic endopeptidase [Acidimicrobiales bacterium]|nr:CPBP family intramembrane glutamic endopeptidase [Acidimicrobiales bacterium]